MEGNAATEADVSDRFDRSDEEFAVSRWGKRNPDRNEVLNLTSEINERIAYKGAVTFAFTRPSPPEHIEYLGSILDPRSSDKTLDWESEQIVKLLMSRRPELAQGLVVQTVTHQFPGNWPIVLGHRWSHAIHAWLRSYGITK